MPGKLKPIPEGKEGAGLRALKKKNPELVREQFRYMKRGGRVSLLSEDHPDIFKASSGQARGMGAAIRGGKFSKNG
mgnify:CR=1 FL=1